MKIKVKKERKERKKEEGNGQIKREIALKEKKSLQLKGNICWDMYICN